MKTPVSTGRVMLPTRLRLLSKGIRLLMVVATLIRNGRRNGRCKTNSEGYDYPVIRYAEVLLNYAEAVYERDDAISDDDLNISLNLVRNRINKSMPKLSNNLVTANGLNMREEIRRERTVELFNEGFRIDDLKRWKTAETEMPKDFLGIKWTGTEYANQMAECFLREEQ